MVTPVALVTDHDNVADWPARIDAGAAVSDATGSDDEPPDVRSTTNAPNSGPVCAGIIGALPTGRAADNPLIGMFTLPEYVPLTTGAAKKFSASRISNWSPLLSPSEDRSTVT